MILGITKERVIERMERVTRSSIRVKPGCQWPVAGGRSKEVVGGRWSVVGFTDP